MNTTDQERAKNLLPWIQAIAEGKTVEHQTGYNRRWEAIDLAFLRRFECEPKELRIKPVPLKLWVNHYKDGLAYCHNTAEAAKEAGYNGENCLRIAVPMIEVEQ